PEPPAIENPITSSSRQIFLKRVSLSLTSLKNTPERRVSLKMNLHVLAGNLKNASLYCFC
ncbi:MAG: hypothetical protein V3U65_10185, partial [Granulosicoccaceae bacterium]